MPQIITSRDELQQRVKDGAYLSEVLPAKEFARAHLSTLTGLGMNSSLRSRSG